MANYQDRQIHEECGVFGVFGAVGTVDVIAVIGVIFTFAQTNPRLRNQLGEQLADALAVAPKIKPADKSLYARC